MKREDIVSVGKGGLLAGIGAALTFFGQWASGADLGQAGVVVAAVVSVLANVFRKWALPEVK